MVSEEVVGHHQLAHLLELRSWTHWLSLALNYFLECLRCNRLLLRFVWESLRLGFVSLDHGLLINWEFEIAFGAVNCAELIVHGGLLDLLPLDLN